MPKRQQGSEYAWFRNVKNKGLTLPGYNYLGPFNAQDNGKPTNPSDAAAQVHDKAYGELLKQGHNPYLKFSDADQKFIDTVGTDWGGRIGKAVFQAKKFLAPHIHGKRKDPFFNKLTNEPVKRAKQSLANFQANAQMSNQATGSGLQAGLSETPIDEVGNVFRGPPNYTFASLPFIETKNYASSAYLIDYTVRPTSPYDPRVSDASTDYNAGAGTATTITGIADVSDASPAKTRWFDFYAGMYKYYHTVAARWTMTIENNTNDLIWCHVLTCNDTTPPLAATNDDMTCWSGVESHLVGSHAVAVASTGSMERNDAPDNVPFDEDQAQVTTANYETSNHVSRRGVGPILKLSGKYAPGDFNREIRLDSEVENWTLVSANPALPERLIFRFKHFNSGIGDNDAQSYDRAFDVTIRFQIEYLVEFKELKDGLKWPVNKQPLAVTINTDIN